MEPRFFEGGHAAGRGAPSVDTERACEALLWRIRRIRRRIRKGYYDRPEIRAQIVESLMQSFLDKDPEPPR